jgi:tetratricopeptide (TPR) repeat protein
MTTLHDILEKARTSGQKLQPSEAAVVFAAAVRLAASRTATLRPRLLHIDEAGGLHLDPLDERALETEPAYMAPELFGPGAQRKNEPRVQVYAAGALGYELMTGMPVPQRGPGPELSGPLGDIVRIALSRDRRERFGDLTQLQDALAEVAARPPAEGERNILLAVRNRAARPPNGKDPALARLAEKVSALENQLGKVAAFEQHLIKLDAHVQSLGESLEHFEEGQRRIQPRKPSSSAAPGFIAGILGAAIALGAAWAAGLVGPGGRVAPAAPVAAAVDAGGGQQAAEKPPPPEPATPPAEKPPPPVEKPAAAVAAEKPPAVETEKPAAAADSGQAAPAETAASDQAADAASPQPAAASPQAAAAEASPQPAAASDAGTAPADASRAAAAPARAAKRPTVSPSAMNHALALSQVRRGENALEHGHADDALSDFKSALDSEPNIAVAWRGMGMALAVQGKDAQALKAYEKYLQLAPSASDAADIRKSMAELKERGKLGEKR